MEQVVGYVPSTHPHMKRFSGGGGVVLVVEVLVVVLVVVVVGGAVVVLVVVVGVTQVPPTQLCPGLQAETQLPLVASHV